MPGSEPDTKGILNRQVHRRGQGDLRYHLILGLGLGLGFGLGLVLELVLGLGLGFISLL